MQIKENNLTKEQRLKVRKHALDLLNKGFSNKQVADIFNIHNVTVSKWKKQGLNIQNRGRKTGEKKNLSKKQEEEILKELLENKTFKASKQIPFWTKNSILKMIKKKYRKNLPSSTLGDYLKNWNLNSNKVQIFKLKFIEKIGHETYENFKKEAKRKYANIWWIHIETIEEKTYFIINNNTGLLILDLHNSTNLIQCFIDFLFTSTDSTKKRFFFVVNGLKNSQYDELLDYIQKNLNTQILEFIPANLLK